MNNRQFAVSPRRFYLLLVSAAFLVSAWGVGKEGEKAVKVEPREDLAARSERVGVWRQGTGVFFAVRKRKMFTIPDFSTSSTGVITHRSFQPVPRTYKLRPKWTNACFLVSTRSDLDRVLKHDIRLANEEIKQSKVYEDHRSNVHAGAGGDLKTFRTIAEGTEFLKRIPIEVHSGYVTVPNAQPRIAVPEGLLCKSAGGDAGILSELVSSGYQVPLKYGDKALTLKYEVKQASVWLHDGMLDFAHGRLGELAPNLEVNISQAVAYPLEVSFLIYVETDFDPEAKKTVSTVDAAHQRNSRVRGDPTARNTLLAKRADTIERELNMSFSLGAFSREDGKNYERFGSWVMASFKSVIPGTWCRVTARVSHAESKVWIGGKEVRTALHKSKIVQVGSKKFNLEEGIPEADTYLRFTLRPGCWSRRNDGVGPRVFITDLRINAAK